MSPSYSKIGCAHVECFVQAHAKSVDLVIMIEESSDRSIMDVLQRLRYPRGNKGSGGVVTKDLERVPPAIAVSRPVGTFSQNIPTSCSHHTLDFHTNLKSS